MNHFCVVLRMNDIVASELDIYALVGLQTRKHVMMCMPFYVTTMMTIASIPWHITPNSNCVLCWKYVAEYAFILSRNIDNFCC